MIRAIGVGPLLLLLAVGAACTSPRKTTRAADNRAPLGTQFQTYRAPAEDPPAVRRLPPAEPKGRISLKTALSLALLRSPTLAAFSWEVRAREAAVIQASLLPNPEIEIEAEEVGGGGERGGLGGAELSAVLSQLIELGGKRAARTGVAEGERDVGEWEYESARLDVYAATLQSFLEALAAQEKLGLARQALELAQQVHAAASERVLAGKASPLERTRAEVALSTARISMARAATDLDVARARLARSWGSASPEFSGVDGRLGVVHVVPDRDELLRRVTRNPDLARWDAEEALARSRVELAEAGRYPDLTISGGVQQFRETDEQAYVIGVSIPLPFFDRNQGAVSEARRRLRKVREERRGSEQLIVSELLVAQQELASSHAAVEAFRKSVLPAAEAAFEAVRTAYQERQLGYLEVLDAQRTLFEVREQHVDALLDYRHAAARVERLTGTPLQQATDDQNSSLGDE